MRTQRRIAAIITNMPPLNIRRSQAFFLGAICAFHSIYMNSILDRVACFAGQNGLVLATQLTGSGMERRYMSVVTFSTTVKNRSIFEMAGWQWS